MKFRHAMTAVMGGLLLSCQGPAAVLAQEAAAVARPPAAITAAQCQPGAESALRPTDGRARQ